MQVFQFWQEVNHKCLNDIIDAPVVLPAKAMGLQHMMISKIDQLIYLA